MKTLLLGTGVALGAILAVAIAVLSLDAHKSLASLNTLLTQASGTAARLDQTVVDVQAAAKTLNLAASEERTNWKATSREAALTGREMRRLISRVDRSFVDGTLYHVNRATLPAIDAQIVSNGEQLTATLRKVGDAADGLTLTAGALNLRIGDPKITSLLGHFDASAQNLEVISANSAAMSGDMRIAVHRMAQPPTKFHQFLDASWTTVKFGSLFIP